MSGYTFKDKNKKTNIVVHNNTVHNHKEKSGVVILTAILNKSQGYSKGFKTLLEEALVENMIREGMLSKSVGDKYWNSK